MPLLELWILQLPQPRRHKLDVAASETHQATLLILIQLKKTSDPVCREAAKRSIWTQELEGWVELVHWDSFTPTRPFNVKNKQCNFKINPEIDWKPALGGECRRAAALRTSCKFRRESWSNPTYRESHQSGLYKSCLPFFRPLEQWYGFTSTNSESRSKAPFTINLICRSNLKALLKVAQRLLRKQQH